MSGFGAVAAGGLAWCEEGEVVEGEVAGTDLLAAGVEVEVEAVDGVDLREAGLAEATVDIADSTSLRERFGAPPFTVLNARNGWWQTRKAAWIALGNQSELGRGAVPSGSLMPVVNPATGKIARSDSRAGVIPGTDAKRSATHG